MNRNTHILSLTILEILSKCFYIYVDTPLTRNMVDIVDKNLECVQRMLSVTHNLEQVNQNKLFVREQNAMSLQHS